MPTRSNSPSSYCSLLAAVLTLVPSYNKTPDGRCYFLKMALQWVWSHVFFASWERADFSLFNLDGTLQYSTKRMGYVVPKAGSSKAVGFMPGSPPGLALGTQPSCWLPGDSQHQPSDVWAKGASEPADASSPGLPATPADTAQGRPCPHRALTELSWSCDVLGTFEGSSR